MFIENFNMDYITFVFVWCMMFIENFNCDYNTIVFQTSEMWWDWGLLLSISTADSIEGDFTTADKMKANNTADVDKEIDKASKEAKGN